MRVVACLRRLCKRASVRIFPVQAASKANRVTTQEAEREKYKNETAQQGEDRRGHVGRRFAMPAEGQSFLEQARPMNPHGAHEGSQDIPGPPRASWARFGPPGASWARFGPPGISWARFGPPGVSWARFWPPGLLGSIWASWSLLSSIFVTFNA